jgi:hypothetical protein
MCPSVELVAASSILGFTVDATHVYWQPSEIANRQILRTPKTGGASDMLLSGLGVISELTVAGNNLVFVNVGFGKLARLSKDGSAGPFDLTVNVSGGVQGVTADGETLFYIRSSNAVWRTTSLGCCSESKVGDVPGATGSFALGQTWAFVHTNQAPFDVIQRVERQGSGVAPFTDELTDVAEGATEILADDDFVYWFVADAIRRKAKQGSNARVEDVVATGVSPTSFAVDPGAGGFVYFLDDASATLMRVVKEGGEPVSLTPVPVGEGQDLVVGGDALYWIESTTSLRRLSKPPP